MAKEEKGETINTERFESRKQWGETNMMERVWPPHRFAAPSFGSGSQALSSSPPLHFHQHFISGVNRPTRRCHRPPQPLFTSETADIPPFRAAEEQPCWGAFGAEPREVKRLSNICQSSSNELKPDGTSLPPLVRLPRHLQLLCYVAANLSSACRMHLNLQGS